jgi:hypothetical protein
MTWRTGGISIFIFISSVTASGILFVPRGTIVFAAAEWILHIDLGLKALQHAFAEVQGQITEFNTLCETLAAQEGSTSENFISALSSQYRENVEQDFVVLESVLNDLQSVDGRRRSDRGLINMIGYGLHFLAGTATDEQVQTLSKRISMLARQTEQQLNGRYTFLANTSKTLERHDHMLSQTISALKALEKELSQRNSVLTATVSAMQLLNRLLTTLQVGFLSISRHIGHLLTEARHLQEATSLAEAGVLTSSIISPDLLRRTLNQAVLKLTPDLAFVGFDRGQVLPLYKYAHVRVSRQGGTIALIIVLPLKQKGIIFTLFSAHSFPIPTAEGGQAVFARPDSPYLAAGNKTDAFVLMPLDYSQHCTRGEVYVCPPRYPIHTSIANSCNIAIFLNNSEAIQQNCDIHFTKSPFVVYIKGEKLGHWLFSVSKEINLNINCPFNYSRLSIRGQGSLHLSSGCTAHDGLQYLPRTMEPFHDSFATPTEISVEPFKAMFFINSTYVNIANHSDSLRNIFIKLERLNTHNLPSISMNNIERDVKLLSSVGEEVSTVKISGSLLITTVFVVFSIVFVILVCYVKKKQHIPVCDTQKIPTDSMPNDRSDNQNSAVNIINIKSHVPLFPEL